MKKKMLLALIASLAFLAANVPAENATTNNLIAVTNAPVGNAATNPVPRDPKWVKRHEGFVKIAQQGGVNLLFLGDSITDFWRNRGSNVWNNYYASRHAANFGISGDRTQHLLWRMENGELDGIHPKVVVLLIGTNNTGKERNSDVIRNIPPEAIEGVAAVVKELRAKLPESKIIFLAIFPRMDGGLSQQAEVDEINKAIMKLGSEKNVSFLDINKELLGPSGVLSKDVMPDLLHPNENGYQIWAKAIEPLLAQLLGEHKFMRPLEHAH